MNRNRLQILLVLLTLSTWVATPTALAVNIVNESFGDNNRTGQNPPSSLNWHMIEYSGDTEGVSSNVWTLNPSSTIGALAYFTPEGSPINLVVGETITLTFSLSFETEPASNAQNFRLGLFNSGTGAGGRISSDLTNMTDSAFTDDNGYAAFLSFSQTGGLSNGLRLRRRDNNNDQLWTAGAFDDLLNTTNTATSGTTFDVSFSVSYLAPGEVELNTSAGGQNGTIVDDDVAFTSFDMISFYSNGALGDISISNVRVDVIPEPGVAVCLALAGAGVLLRRRRRL